MNELISLQLQYGNAVFQIERYQRERDLAKARLDELADMAASKESTAEPRQINQDGSIEPQANTVKAFIQKRRSLRGICSKVARELGLSQTQVHRVANGEGKSARVTAALEREYAKRQEDQER